MKVLTEQSHNILPLTLYHKEIDLGEWLWETVKNFFAGRNLIFKMNHVIKFVDGIFPFISKEDCEQRFADNWR
jgi:hypothetical protein